ncbi:hypothetical protein ABZ929_08505 [Streptomyces physcomitrii]|uniref:hypothetical protein n=1 Tax=Streptomyces physcomitrii TaxID=2724184 RepID=UPI0033C9B0FE
MALRDVQVFLAEYVRDRGVRERCREEGGLDAVLGPRALTAEERQLITTIDLDDLSKVAETVLRERFDRLSSVFALLFEHLAPHTDVSALYRRFDDEHRHGWWQRRREIRRFEAYVSDFIIREQLPPYLLDLVRLCAYITTVAESPKAAAPDHADLPGAEAVRANYGVRLRRPYAVLSMRYDVLPLLDESDTVQLVTTPTPRRVLVQRSWQEHKRCQVFDLGAEPLVEAIGEELLTVGELAGRLPQFGHAELYEEVAALHRDGIVHLVVPPELAGDLALRGAG